MNSRIPFAVASCAIPLFFVALYGGFGLWSFVLASASVAALLVCVVWGLLQLRHTAFVAPHRVVIAGLALGALLHAHEQALASNGASVAWLLWALVPYVPCAVASVVPATRLPAITGICAALLVDLLVHYEVFINPTSSTAGLAMLFAPAWSALLVVPLAMLASWLVLRLSQRHRHAP